MSSVMRRRRGVMEKVLLGFVAHNIPLSSQRRSGGERLRFDSNRCAFGGFYRKRVPLHTAKRFSPKDTIPSSGLSRVIVCQALFSRNLARNTRHSPRNEQQRDAGAHGEPTSSFLR